MIPGVVKECEERGFIKVDKGAKCFYLDKFKIPLMVVKSDGGFNYDSTDMAAIRYRIKDLGCNRLIYITDAGQKEHFMMVFAAA